MGHTPLQSFGERSQDTDRRRPAVLSPGRANRSRPAKRIIRNRKKLAERQKNCVKQNALIDQVTRRECMRGDGFDPFDVPIAGEAIHLCDDRNASRKRMGRAHDGWEPGTSGSKLDTKQAQSFSPDDAFWARFESDRNAAFDVVRAKVRGLQC